MRRASVLRPQGRSMAHTPAEALALGVKASGGRGGQAAPAGARVLRNGSLMSATATGLNQRDFDALDGANAMSNALANEATRRAQVRQGQRARQARERAWGWGRLVVALPGTSALWGLCAGLLRAHWARADALSGLALIHLLMLRAQEAERQRRMAHDVFQTLDVDGSGALDLSEFQAALKMLGFDVPLVESHTRFKALDRDGSGAVDFDEFYAYISATTGTSMYSVCSVEEAKVLLARKGNQRSMDDNSRLCRYLMATQPFFMQLSAHIAMRLTLFIRLREVPRGAWIIRQNDEGNDLFVIMSGTCAVFQKFDDDNSQSLPNLDEEAKKEEGEPKVSRWKSKKGKIKLIGKLGLLKKSAEERARQRAEEERRKSGHRRRAMLPSESQRRASHMLGEASGIKADDDLEEVGGAEGALLANLPPWAGTYLGCIRDGDSFGEISVMEGCKRRASVRAAQACDLLEIDGAAFNVVTKSTSAVQCYQPEYCRYLMKKRPQDRTEVERLKLTQFTSNMPLFKTLPADLRRVMVGVMVYEEFGANSVVVRQGEPGDSMFIILTGRCAVHVKGGADAASGYSAERTEKKLERIAKKSTDVGMGLRVDAKAARKKAARASVRVEPERRESTAEAVRGVTPGALSLRGHRDEALQQTGRHMLSTLFEGANGDDLSVENIGPCVNSLQAGDCFGELALLRTMRRRGGEADTSSIKRAATIVARTPTTFIRVLKEDYAATLAKFQESQLQLKLQFLRRVAIFEGLGDEELGHLLYYMKVIKVPRNHAVVQQGEQTRGLYIIKSGEVALSRLMPAPYPTAGSSSSPTRGSNRRAAGQRMRVTSTLVLGPCGIFGEETILGGGESQFTTLASSETEVFQLVVHDCQTLNSRVVERVRAHAAQRKRLLAAKGVELPGYHAEVAESKDKGRGLRRSSRDTSAAAGARARLGKAPRSTMPSATVSVAAAASEALRPFTADVSPRRGEIAVDAWQRNVLLSSPRNARPPSSLGKTMEEVLGAASNASWGASRASTATGSSRSQQGSPRRREPTLPPSVVAAALSLKSPHTARHKRNGAHFAHAELFPIAVGLDSPRAATAASSLFSQSPRSPTSVMSLRRAIKPPRGASPHQTYVSSPRRFPTADM